MFLFSPEKLRINHIQVVPTTELSDNDTRFIVFLGDADISKPVTTLALDVFEWLDTAGKAHIILGGPTQMLGLWRRVKRHVSPKNGTVLPLGIMTKDEKGVVYVYATVWHRVGGRILLHLEMTPQDVTEESASGRETEVNYSVIGAQQRCVCLPAGRTPAWMTFKSQPTFGDTVFVVDHHMWTGVYRGGLLLQTGLRSRPRIAGIVDEAYKMTEPPPAGTIDEEWKALGWPLPFCYCVARPWGKKM